MTNIHKLTKTNSENCPLVRGWHEVTGVTMFERFEVEVDNILNIIKKTKTNHPNPNLLDSESNSE
jgi:hypothetical protein